MRGLLVSRFALALPALGCVLGFMSARGLAVEPAPLEYDPRLVLELVAAARQQGDVTRGLDLFCSTRFACLSCHQVGAQGGHVGPCLSDVGRRLKPEEIAESLLWPKRQIKPEFVAWHLVLSDGRSLQGYKRGADDKALRLMDPAAGQTHVIPLADIEAEREVGTLMPEGLSAAMSAEERRDVLRFLTELGRTPGLEEKVRPSGVPAEFVYDRTPLDPARWALWQEHVNRDRLYDWYAKEALYFARQNPRPHLLPKYPGLDGGTLGHWGNQNEEVWKDDRWNQTDLGTLLAGVFHGPQKLVVNKAVCVRLGDSGEMSACFDPEKLAYAAAWRGGFVKFTDTRHGLMSGLLPDGQLLPLPAAETPQAPFVYHGLYRLGRRVVFSYRLGDVEMLDAPWVKDGEFERVLLPASEHPLAKALREAPAQWPQEIRTPAQLGSGRPYAVDTITPPFENPWKAVMLFAGHDFLPDGSAFVCSIHGDVWHVTGLDAQLQDVRWRRFASGLHQALGLVVADDKVYVLGRDQITRLHDVNGDGEADFYECFSNKMVTSSGGHNFTCGLERDREGRFYTASSAQGLIRISADGQQVDVLATGFRNPDGLGLCRDGAVTVPCSEGDWTPTSMICLVKPEQASGDPPHFGYGGLKQGKPPALPLVYLPRGIDNSSGGQVTVPDDRWGPLAGQLIHLSHGMGTHHLVLRDEVDGQPQGAVVPLAGEFRSGAHRGRFHPRDGQLYVTGSTGWGTYTPDDGCFQRVRYTGDPVLLPSAFHVHENGILVSFTQEVDDKMPGSRGSSVSLAPSGARSSETLDVRQQAGRSFAQAWNYRYSPGYGSPELAPSHPGVLGHEVLEIAGIHRIDGRTIFVELPELQPVNTLHLLLAWDEKHPLEMYITVNRLDSPFTNFAGYVAAKKVLRAHPLAVDVALLGKTVPNPWRKRAGNAAPLSISAGGNLTFSTRTLRAKAGEKLSLRFVNPDVVPHNWVLLKPGTLAAVGDLANKLVADPEAVLHHYVPKSDDVLAYTDIVPPQEEFIIYFTAPKEKGRYPYLCTFPGHWMVMNGELIVE